MTLTRGSELLASQICLLGHRVDLLTQEDLTLSISHAVSTNRRLVVANHNLHSLYLAKQLPEFRRFFGECADLVHADGMSLVILGRSCRKPIRRNHRTTYLDWILPLLDTAEANGWRVFYLGGTESNTENVRRYMSLAFPDLTFSTHHGYLDHPDVTKAAIDRVNKFQPDLLFLGMGMPRQELWLSEHWEAVAAKVALTAGGCFDYLTGVQAAPPRWTGRLGLEWLSRLVHNPKRLWRRYLIEPWALLPDYLIELARSWSGR